MYIDEQLITYLGNKRKLIPLIVQAIQPQNKICLDLFSGSGVVSRAFKDNKCKKIIANDLELYSKIINECYLTNIDDFPVEEYEYYYHLILNA
jgi:adenine-specific DNA-methyltransferase